MNFFANTKIVHDIQGGYSAAGQPPGDRFHVRLVALVPAAVMNHDARWIFPLRARGDQAQDRS